MEFVAPGNQNLWLVGVVLVIPAGIVECYARIVLPGKACASLLSGRVDLDGERLLGCKQLDKEGECGRKPAGAKP
jgi:hypothetical protein